MLSYRLLIRAIPCGLSHACGLALASGLLVGALPAQAQRAKSVPQAFAAVQAPEAAAEVCLGTSVQAALDCARTRCARKAGRGACFAVTACEPSGWAGLMGVRMTDVHFTKAICGAPSQDALLTSLKAFCLGHSGLKECAVAQVWGPDGKLNKVDANWTSADDRK